MCILSVAFSVNLYLACCYLFVGELRNLKNYPIFLVNLMDVLVTGPGFFLLFFCENFVRHEAGVYFYKYLGGSYFLRWLHELKFSISPQIWQFAHKLPWFIFGCLPEMLTQRLNEYSGGICAILLAYERYILVCKPFDKDKILSDQKRKRYYILATFGILIMTVGEGIVRYLTYDFDCYTGFTFFKGHKFEEWSRIISGTVTAILFSLIPALFCIYYYYHASSALFGRNKKNGRNLNLIVCFSAICVIWLVTLSVRYSVVLYQTLVNIYAHGLHKYKYPIIRNNHIKYLLFNMSGFSSVFNPFLILLAQTDHREPFLKFLRRFKSGAKLNPTEKWIRSC